MTTTSPWSRQAQAPAPPSVTLPPSSSPTPPAPIPTPPAVAQSPGRRRRRWWPWAVLGLLLTAVMSAAVGSVVTYAMTRTDNATPVSPPAASPTPTTPHFSAAEVEAAKQNLCHIFDTSLSRKGEGGFRVDGNINLPVTLKAVNSAAAVQNALVPATPPDVASAARKYVNATLDATTAAMGNTPTSEVNRLTDAGNDAIYALLDVCGLPR